MTKVSRPKVFRPPPDPFPAQYSTVASGHCLGMMVPDGSELFHDVDAPLSIGDVVTLWMREEAFSSGSQIRTKILVGLTPETITLAALNPPEQYTFYRWAFHAVHKVFAIREPSGAVRDLRTLAGCRAQFARGVARQSSVFCLVED